jgi:hypothetical protein
MASYGKFTGFIAKLGITIRSLTVREERRLRLFENKRKKVGMLSKF